MIIFPAIDLFDGKAVRLYKGDYNNMTVYSNNPTDIAVKFESQGATHMHMVDLEGAKNGTTPNISVVRDVAEKTSLFIEIGGGIRNMETVEKYLEYGADRVILGTAAINDRQFLKEAVLKYGEKISVGADVKNGYIAIKGWLETSHVTLDEFMSEMQDIGVDHIICTDISKDGAMMGTNLVMYRDLCSKYTMKITASGGISTLEDVKKLREMDLYGAIIGKACYTNDIDLADAIKVAE